MLGRRIKQVSIAFVASLIALVLASAGWFLPIEHTALYAVPLSIVAGLHLLVALSCFFPSRALRLLARITGYCSLGVFIALTVQVTSWCVYLFDIYGELGLAFTIGIVVVLLALALFFVPFSLFLLLSLGVTSAPNLNKGNEPALKRGVSTSLLLSVLSFFVVPILFLQSQEVRATPALEQVSEAELLALSRPFLRPQKSAQSLQVKRATQCSRPVRESQQNWLVFFKEGSKVEARCLQAETQAEQLTQLEALLKTYRPARYKLDMLSLHSEVPTAPDFLAALALRPGLDGVCAEGACLAPWQLVTRHDYNNYHPVKAVPDAAFGVDIPSLSEALKAQEPLLRVSSTSFLLTGADAKKKSSKVSIQRLQRMALQEIAVTQETIQSSIDAASTYLLRAQRKRGDFIYQRDPFMEKGAKRRFNLPRHAGTTLALCELERNGAKKPRSKRSAQVIRRALGRMNRLFYRHKDLGYFAKSKKRVRLGETALPLIAILECDARGFKADQNKLAASLGMLLRLQRDDGSFMKGFSLPEEEVFTPREGLFASGQAAYALILLESYEKQHPDFSLWRAAGLSSESTLTDSVEAALTYYAGSYWKEAPRDFFYFEENWHCLAARAALSIHRNDGYERFCIDYMRFRLQFIESAQGQLGLSGGVTVSPLFPPYGTPTAGIAEAGSAAVSLLRARGESETEMLAGVKASIGYLLRLQVNGKTCFACANERAEGGFGESAVAALIRVDFVQHAMAGIFHGGEVLFSKELEDG